MCAASEAACAVELRRELVCLCRAAAAAFGCDADLVPELPPASSFSGGRVCRVVAEEFDGAVRVQILAAAPGAARGAASKTTLDLVDCHGDMTKALDFVTIEVSRAWRQLTRPETKTRTALGALEPNASKPRSEASLQVDDYHTGKWVPDKARARARKTALEKASIDKLHRGRAAYLTKLVKDTF